MTLNLTNFKDLEHICAMAIFGLSGEQAWLGRIVKYQELFRAEINRWESGKEVYLADPARKDFPPTGILVRACLPDGSFDSVDIAQLTKESLFAWLRSRGGANEWAENTVALLLGYEVE